MPLLYTVILLKTFITSGLSLIFLYLYKQNQEKFMRQWAISWLLFAVRVFLDLLRYKGYDSIGFLLANQLTSVASVVLLLSGMYAFLGKQMSKNWIIAAIGATFLSDLAFAFQLPFGVGAMPTCVFFAVIDVWTGIQVLRHWKFFGQGRIITGYALIVLGIANGSYPFFSTTPGPMAVYGFLTGSVLEMIIICGTLIGYLQKVGQELLENQERFRLLADNAKDIIFRYTMGKGFEYISPACQQITGYQPSEFYESRKLLETIIPGKEEDFKSNPEILNMLLQTQIRTKDGRFVWVEHQIVPFKDPAGELIAIEGIIRDISDRKRVESEIARLDQLRLLGETAASIAHEIRNPMTTVHGFLQLFQNKPDLAGYNGHFKLMLEELDRANDIIKDFLSLSKKKRVDLVMTDLNRVILTLMPLIETMALASSKIVSCKLQSLPQLFLDEKEIRQMILNLAQNGLEAMEPSGELNISTIVDARGVTLVIKDHGKGIPGEILTRLGTPFLTTKEFGTGIGLAVCYSIAARHDADIKVETSSKGTGFYITFKLKEE